MFTYDVLEMSQTDTGLLIELIGFLDGVIARELCHETVEALEAKKIDLTNEVIRRLGVVATVYQSPRF